MQEKTTVQQIIIQQFGVAKVETMLAMAKKKNNAGHIAVHRYRGGVLFFYMQKGSIWCDYQDEKGFIKTHYKSYSEFFEDLGLVGFFYSEIRLLEAELQKTCVLNKQRLKPFVWVENRINGLMDSIVLRSKNDKRNSEYWAGQRDILEILKVALNEVRDDYT